MQSELQRLIRDLGQIPKDLQKELRPAVKKAAEVVKRDAQARSSWSTRIPGAMRVVVKLAGSGAGASVVVSAAKAPHARPYENLGNPGTFRHPVYGNREVWVPQAARPFLFPAAQAKADAATEEIDKAVREVLRRNGFH
jgi:hypothetical protein